MQPACSSAAAEPAAAPPREGLVARHGAAALFSALAAVFALLRLRAGALELAGFERRIVSEATLAAFDVGARIRLYYLALLAALSTGGAALFALRLLERRVPAAQLRVVNALALAGVAALYLSLFGLEPDATLGLVVALQGLALASALPARPARWLGAAPYVAFLGSSAVGLLFPLFQAAGVRLRPTEMAAAAAVLVLGLALHAGIGLLARGGDEPRARARVERAVHAALPLAALGLVPFLRDESYLLLEGRGLRALTPTILQAALVAALLAWMFLRWRRAGAPGFELALERRLGRASFPLLFAGALTLVEYRPFLDPYRDFLEPANAGLSIQQWVDYGRLPFAETFDVHGLWDSAYGFLYAALAGHPRELWGFYDFGITALPVLLLYLFVRRVTASPYLALFAAALLPYAHELAPAYCAPALVALFPLERAARRRTFGAYLALFLACAGLALWRLDIGFAASAAVVATLLLARLAVGEPVLRAGRAIAAGLAALALAALGWTLLCRAGGVDPLQRFRDLLLVLDSNQAYGHPRLAQVENEVVRFHLYAVPAAVLLLALALLRDRRRERGAPEDPSRRAIFLGLLFLCGYYFANAPRGLVRHTFEEPGNVYLASFGALALGLWPWWRWGRTRPALAVAGLVAVTSVLAFHFPLASPRAKVLAPEPELWAELVDRLPLREPVAPRDEPLARDGVPADFAARHYGELKAFLDANLAREETFLDLAHCPMLYVYTHRISPHWLNHLMCAPGEPSQLRVLEELAGFEVPVVVLAQDLELAAEDEVRWTGETLDGVPFRLRQYALFEHAYAEYEPFALLGRWHVWLRKGTLLAAPPGAEVEEHLALRPGGASTRAGEGADGGSALELEGLGEPRTERMQAAALLADRAAFLRLEGDAREPLELQVELELRTPEGLETLRRDVSVLAGALDGSLFLLVPERRADVERLRLRCEPPGALALEALVLEARSDPAYAKLAERERRTQVTALGQLPWIWARHDERRAERRTAAVLLAAGPAPAGEVSDELALADQDLGKWRRGVHLEVPAVLLADEAAAESVAPGDTLVLAGSGRREVRSRAGRQVLLSGAPLDPAADGSPHAVRWLRPAPRGELVGPGAPLELELPAARAERPLHYLVLSVANRSLRARELVLEHGVGERTLGRFRLALRGDREEHEYCVRASIHASWWGRPAGWLRIASVGGEVELRALELADGP